MPLGLSTTTRPPGPSGGRSRLRRAGPGRPPPTGPRPCGRAAGPAPVPRADGPGAASLAAGAVGRWPEGRDPSGGALGCAAPARDPVTAGGVTGAAPARDPVTAGGVTGAAPARDPVTAGGVTGAAPGRDPV